MKLKAKCNTAGKVFTTVISMAGCCSECRPPRSTNFTSPSIYILVILKNTMTNRFEGLPRCFPYQTTNIRKNSDSDMASLAANTCKLEGVAAAAAESSAKVAPSSPRPVASSTPDADRGRGQRKSKQPSSGCTMELRSRKYTEILGRRGIHAYRSGQKTPKSVRATRPAKTPKISGTPGTPKTAKRLSKSRLKM
ncbi:uncharacterized protein LOC135438968 [Drosophila montana]|uniref:uncharacterized protein LOC135438968 n=1 Tax=Drosophila montana TaxID=40370 RepID=UPI00313A8396